MTEEQKDDALVLLECNAEELAGLPNGQGMQDVANVCNLLDYLHTFEPKVEGNQMRVTHISVYG